MTTTARAHSSQAAATQRAASSDTGTVGTPHYSAYERKLMMLERFPERTDIVQYALDYLNYHEAPRDVASASRHIEALGTVLAHQRDAAQLRVAALRNLTDVTAHTEFWTRDGQHVGPRTSPAQVLMQCAQDNRTDAEWYQWNRVVQFQRDVDYVGVASAVLSAGMYDELLSNPRWEDARDRLAGATDLARRVHNCPLVRPDRTLPPAPHAAVAVSVHALDALEALTERDVDAVLLTRDADGLTAPEVALRDGRADAVEYFAAVGHAYTVDAAHPMADAVSRGVARYREAYHACHELMQDETVLDRDTSSVVLGLLGTFEHHLQLDGDAS